MPLQKLLILFLPSCPALSRPLPLPTATLDSALWTVPYMQHTPELRARETLPSLLKRTPTASVPMKALQSQLKRSSSSDPSQPPLENKYAPSPWFLRNVIWTLVIHSTNIYSWHALSHVWFHVPKIPP